MFDFSKALASESDLASELQKLGQQGDFNPMSLFAGQPRFHSLFLAPFSPSLATSVQRFLADGTGPLAGVLGTFQQQGASAAEAMASARSMFAAAQGMCVVVLADDQGVNTVPQLFFGHFQDAYLKQVVELSGPGLAGGEHLASALRELRAKAEGGGDWPALFAAAPDAGGGDLRSYWGGLALRLVAGLDGGIMPTAIERVKDLAHWVGAAVAALPGAAGGLGPEAVVAVVRCHLVAGEIPRAAALIEASLGAGIDEEVFVQLLHHLADGAIGHFQPEPAAEWLQGALERIAAHYPIGYDLLLALFKLQAAAQADAPVLLASADRLAKANRKAVRHDLGREPIWRVAVADPGELLDTAQAAELIGRSPASVAKRLEAGTLPSFRHQDQLRIPRRGLLAWKAVMDAHRLID